MDSVLNKITLSLENTESCENINNKQKEKLNFSTWIENGNEYSPITNSKLLKKLNPGLYEVQNIPNKGIICVKQDINSDDLINFENSIFNNLIQDINNFWELNENFKKYNLIHKRGILLEGPPGNGKSSLITLLIQNLIEHNGVAFKISNSETFFNTISFQKEIFRMIEPETPIINIIEDVDVVSRYIGPELLDYLDGKDSINHSICILTTNNSSDLSSALIRPSRIDRKYLLQPPNEKIRKEYFKHKNIPEKLLNDYVNKTNNYTFAKLKEVFISTIILNNSLEDTIKHLDEEFIGTNYLEDNPTYEL